jgi:hypothetical protein
MKNQARGYPTIFAVLFDLSTIHKKDFLTLYAQNLLLLFSHSKRTLIGFGLATQILFLWERRQNHIVRQ